MAVILSNIMLLLSLVFVVFFAYSLMKPRNQYAGTFAQMCLCIAIYLIGYSFELRMDDPNRMLFFIKLEYFGQPFMTTYWMLFAYKFMAKKDPPLHMSVLALVIPMATTFMCTTNEYHHLFYTSVEAVNHGGLITVKLGKGPWYMVNVFYSYSIVIFGMLVFFKAWMKSGFNFRTQAFWLFFGSLWPTIMNLIYLVGISPYNLDLIPFSFSILALSYYVAVFKYEILDFQDIIRDVTFAGISEGIMVIDNRNRLIDSNSAGQEIFGWLNKGGIGLDLSTFPEGGEILSHGVATFEMSMNRDGTVKHYEFRATELTEKNKSIGRVYFISDVTRQWEMIRELGDMASYDPLTRIYNRRRLVEEVDKELHRVKRYGGSMSLAIIDIDHFKDINDCYGHLAGDEIIRMVVRVIRERIRGTDILGRFGGEEFVLAFNGTTHENAVNIAEDIRESIACAVTRFAGHDMKTTVSVGVATFGEFPGGLDVMQMIYAADMALYRAKNSGRNRVCGNGTEQAAPA